MALLVIALIGACAVVAVLLGKLKDGESRSKSQQLELDSRSKRILELEEQCRSFAKYRVIVDAESEAARIIEEARREASALVASARREAEDIRVEAQRLRVGTADEIKSMRARAEAVVANATSEANKIIEDANKRAKEIAGEALEAKRNVDQLQRAADALKNVIEGYGDRYVVPSFSLLDELAEEFGFADAGQRLKSARERMRQMIKDGTAATCDYVEEYRRTTAVAFVLDAFNGKVDTILSSAKHDNFGTLEQKVRDAFSLVNLNGAAFRNARITPEYLQQRLEELRWAVAANELKLKEREEQRQMKERIREEEKAQREYERAMKDAEKEEKTIKDAMEKAKKEAEKASEDQKAKYEEQLALLAEKLKQAEEKNKKALSMAQQTKAGNVYIISNVGSFGEDIYKIGLTRRLDPMERVRELSDASVPFDFDVHSMIYCEDAPSLERDLHKHFVKMQLNKVNPRKEFFRVPLGTIREEVERMGFQARWTMAAESREYKETLAIERAMKDETFREGEWVESQLQEREVRDEELREAS